MIVRHAYQQILSFVQNVINQLDRELYLKMIQKIPVVRLKLKLIRLLVPLTISQLSSDLNCDIFDYENQQHCLKCKSGYYLGKDSYYNTTTDRYQNGCQKHVQPTLCIEAQSEFECDICIQGYSTYQIGIQNLCYYQNGIDVFQYQILACLDGYVNQLTGTCVTNCGIGRYGNTSFNNKGMIETTLCQDCNSSCYECASKNECKSCKRGYYLKFIDGGNTGSCLLKQGQFERTIYVQTREKLETEAIIDGSIYQPYHSLQDALTAAYILGSPYESATITILLFSNQSHSMIRYQPNLGIFKNFDKNSQTTKIIIDTIDQQEEA
ncbi:UNKNOWN [Stylonychia lemnae]|uniref:Uncharacterized protein n=1 Tax=Stylonychia lemnae TaxID=5949 RepID=A0A078ALH9_STYLE|nr:UNKNOWN [Stylonychia lemnae]|eukprot:CDW83215.1 UNKNOWN [Stylonychia lemnae]